MKRYFAFILLTITVFSCLVSAHEGHEHPPHAERHVVSERSEVNENPNLQPPFFLVAMQAEPEVGNPAAAVHFEKFKNVKVRQTADSLVVESNGLPTHNMMIGIRNWQQQVPISQPFTGANAWKIPLHPELAANPISVRKKALRGAIALAVNGVPIFCALNNRGEDSNLLGELDKWGGHCGRGDDYHYHVAPVHLEKIVGKGNPIAYALDGFPIYGYTNADGSPVGKLDEFNGQFDENGNYHYHATEKFPYVNGGLRGEVTMRGDQIDQPRDSPIRSGQRPLRGAKITGFKTTDSTSVLKYELRGKEGTISYSPAGTNAWKFTYADPDGRTRTETYERRAQRQDRNGNGRRRERPPRR
ncbi:MAG: YHYH protein [Planctomycetota bacterium]